MKQQVDISSAQHTQLETSTSPLVRLAEDQLKKIVQHVYSKIQESLNIIVKSTIKQVLDEYRSSSEPSDSILPSTSRPKPSLNWNH